MTVSNSTADKLALSAICGHWLGRACTEFGVETLGDVHTGMALSLVGLHILDRSITADGGVEVGFQLAMRMVAAVINDPLGDVTDRERGVRARWLARPLEGDVWGAADSCCHALVLRTSEAAKGNRAFELPSDLASAEMAARAISDASSTAVESAEIAHIMQKLDEEETFR